MKATKIMLGFVGTLILTWMGMSTLVYLCTEGGTFRDAATNPGVGLFMFVFGWIPSLIVSIDLDTKFTQ